ncbi:hypothetical protein, partial [Pseudomonas sp. PS02285]|uniref:hypothetical protein n=1 Tax=Pseudomonas sp. PS02285 TaxID=2991441 RepID=UPI00249CB51A
GASSLAIGCSVRQNKKARTECGQDRSFYQEPGVNRLSIKKQKKHEQFYFFNARPTNGSATASA